MGKKADRQAERMKAAQEREKIERGKEIDSRMAERAATQPTRRPIRAAMTAMIAATMMIGMAGSDPSRRNH